MKAFLAVILIGALCLGGLVFWVSRHQEETAETAARTLVWWVLGTWPEIGDFKLDVKGHSVRIRDLNIRNPEGFPPGEKWMVQAPEIGLVYDPASLSRKKLILKELDVRIKEITIVRDPNKGVNLESLKFVRERKEKANAAAQKGKPLIPWEIGRFHLKLDWVVYKDYGRGKQPLVEEDPRVFDEVFHNVTDADELRRGIIAKYVSAKAVSAVAQYQMGLFGRRMPLFALSRAGRSSGSAATQELVKILFPSGEKGK